MENTELNTLKLKELQTLAAEIGIKKVSGMKKSELVKAIQETKKQMRTQKAQSKTIRFIRIRLGVPI